MPQCKQFVLSMLKLLCYCVQVVYQYYYKPE
jgi:hypothetical protein